MVSSSFSLETGEAAVDNCLERVDATDAVGSIRSKAVLALEAVVDAL